MALWIPSALYADATFDRWAQDVVSLVTWALLAAVFLRGRRARATAAGGRRRGRHAFEITFSIIWGLYVYRFANLPLYVPPGHGLIYLLALRHLAARPGRAQPARHVGHRHGRGLRVGGAEGWCCPSTPTWSGSACCRRCCTACGSRGAGTSYAGAFVATTTLEIVGTQFGNWRWADTVPGIGLSQGNPPSAIAAGYCLLDAIVLFLSSRVWLARVPFGGRAPLPEPVTEAAG